MHHSAIEKRQDARDQDFKTANQYPCGRKQKMDDNSLYVILKDWILQLPKVTEAPHRFGGTEFQVEGVEFMHSHGPAFLDIRLSKEDQTKALKSGGAIPHRFASQAGWVSFRIVKAGDVDNAKKLVQLAYENARNNVEAHKSRRMQAKLG